MIKCTFLNTLCLLSIDLTLTFQLLRNCWMILMKLAESKYSMSVIKFVIFSSIHLQRWLPWPLGLLKCFWLLFCSYGSNFDKIWLEGRTECPLSSLRFFSGQSVNNDGLHGLWLAVICSTFLLQPRREFEETGNLTGSKGSMSSTKFILDIWHVIFNQAAFLCPRPERSAGGI